jgi:hypothetical protein
MVFPYPRYVKFILIWKDLTNQQLAITNTSSSTEDIHMLVENHSNIKGVSSSPREDSGTFFFFFFFFFE